MKIWIRKLAQLGIRISARPLDLYCIHRTPASSPSPPRPRLPHTKLPRFTGAMPVLPPTPDARAAPKGHRQHYASPSAVRHRLSPHRPGIFDDLFADTKTLRSPPQALANAMNHLTDTDTNIDRQRERDAGRCASALWTHPRQSHHCPLRLANAPYGFGTSSTPHRVLVLAIPCRRHTTNATNAPYGTPRPPTAAAPPPSLPPPGFWFMVLRDTRPGPVKSLSVCLLVAGCSCLSSTPVVHGRSVLQLLAGPPLSCLTASVLVCTPAAHRAP